MKILILGATGFIGSTIANALFMEGHEVTGLGRNIGRNQRKLPAVEWIRVDLARMTTAQSWKNLIECQDAIVNCAGALQDGLSDDLEATQQNSMQALYGAAMELSGKLIVQISARTDGAASASAFLATKRIADTALAASGLPHVILRPALVIGRNAHGGTALIRALASIPFIIPLIHANSPVQVIAVDDVASAVSKAIGGRIPVGSDIDLAAPEQLTLWQLVMLHRQWLGVAPGRVICVPNALAKPITWLADIAGQLGWRSPLRSTAMAVMSKGVISDGRNSVGLELIPQSARETLSRHPSGAQDLWFARLYLLKPVIILTLSLFWLLSGFMPLLQPSRAAAHFLPFMSYSLAIAITLMTCAVDIGLGLMAIFRPFSRAAMLGMLGVTASYLAGASLLEPELWIDPLGPLVKVLPSFALTLVALAVWDER